MTETLAARTREAVRSRPFLLEALAAGVVNYAAAAEHLDVDGDDEAVATALRRFEPDLARATEDRDVRVRMERGVGPGEGDPLLSVGGTSITPGGDLTALLATGDVDARSLSAAIDRLATAGIEVTGGGVSERTMVVVVDGRPADALRACEAALDAVPRVDEP